MHGKLFHNGHYDKGVAQYAKDKDPWAFVQNIGHVYATSPVYANSITNIMKTYNLV
jgi:flagellum-specific peptidoglycan hydrolase FlgJ